MILTYLFLILAAGCYTISQLQQQGKLKWMGDRLGFWGEDSHLRKYKNIHKEKGKFQVAIPDNNWYYSVFIIKYKERFPLSTTLLVFVTDGYHFSQWLFKIFICLAFVPHIGWIWSAGLWVTFGVAFTLVYKYSQK